MTTKPDGYLHCPLCAHDGAEPFYEDAQRVYLRCPACRLVFVPERYWLSHAEEKATYDLHENDPRDAGYLHFLSRLSEPLAARLAQGSEGLDFGCGPGPALAGLFAGQGHRISLYDPFYFNDPALLERRYDFICATEVVEHLRRPDREFARLFGMLEQGGWLGIMTKMVRDHEAFRRWHYIRDLTHICFYSRETFTHLASRHHSRLEVIGNDVILLRKG